MRDEKPTDTPDDSKPKQHHDGQGTSDAPDRAQPELTEQNLLTEKRSEAETPEERDALEDELEEMEGEIREANDK